MAGRVWAGRGGAGQDRCGFSFPLNPEYSESAERGPGGRQHNGFTESPAEGAPGAENLPEGGTRNKNLRLRYPAGRNFLKTLKA